MRAGLMSHEEHLKEEEGGESPLTVADDPRNSVDSFWHRSRERYSWLLIITLICALFLCFALVNGNLGVWVSGLFVPDGITLLESARDDAHESIGDVFENHKAAAGLAIFNAQLVAVHDLLPALLNFLMLLFVFGSLARHGSQWALVMFVFTPYYLISFPLPSKDILVATMFVIAVIHFMSFGWKRLFYPLIMTAAMFFVRDGYAIILCISFVMIVIVERIKLSPTFLIVGVCVAASIFWTFFDNIFQEYFLYARAFGIAEQSEVLDIDMSLTPLGFIIRLVGNATNLAFRPRIWDCAGNLHLLSVLFWISGITLLFALVCCWRALYSKIETDRRIGLLGLLSLIMVSVAPYVQPRYLLPICLLVPMFSFVSFDLFRRSFIIIVPIAIIVAALYHLVGNYPPPAEQMSFNL
jgi:hypothetical protein